MGFMNASRELNDRSWGLITAAFKDAVPDGAGYTLCYGYWIKSGFLTRTMYSYAVGFCADTKDIILIPINSDGEITGEPIHFQKSNVTKVKKTMQGGWEITSSLTDKPLVLIVPGFVPDSGESAYQLPINQIEQAQTFISMMKSY